MPWILICKMGTDFWEKAIRKDLENFRIESKKFNGVTPEQIQTGKIKPGYKYCSNHIIFDIKMEVKFTSKSHLVGNGHNTGAPASITYSSVVSRDSVMAAFLIDYLDDLDANFGRSYGQ